MIRTWLERNPLRPSEWGKTGILIPVVMKGNQGRDHVGRCFALVSSNQVNMKMHSNILILAKTRVPDLCAKMVMAHVFML